MICADPSSMHPADTEIFRSYEYLLSAIVDSSDDAIVSKNLDGIITSWNKSAERIFGFTDAEAIGQPVTILIPEERQDEEKLILQRLREGLRVDHFETVRRRKDGTTLEVSLTISPVKNGEGVVVGASKIARDISARKKIEAEALRTAEEMERQSRIKDEFVATISHELRTPLQAIFGWVQLLRHENPTPEELAEGLEVIERNAQAQSRIVEDLLEMNRILSGKMRLDIQPVDLGIVVDEALESIKPAAIAKDIAIKKILNFPAPPVMGDPARLQQVFWNLFSNALKFTPRAGTITIHMMRVDSHVEVSITDTGAGISPEFLPHVFERFRQADGTTTRQHGGLGLGLAIVKNLVELHGGTAAVQSPGLGKGATFTLTFPIAGVVDEGADTGAGPDGPSSGALKGVEVLVVDDEPDSRLLLAHILRRAGASVLQAKSGGEALTMLKTSRPQLIVSDIGMPGMDGHTFIRAVRALPDEKVSGIPALALTAYTRTEDRMKAIAAGFQMHMGKPAGSAELVLLASTILKWRL